MAAACAAVAREGLTVHVERVCHRVRHTGHSVCTTQPPPPEAIRWCVGGATHRYPQSWCNSPCPLVLSCCSRRQPASWCSLRCIMATATQRRRPPVQRCRCPQILSSPVLFRCTGMPALAAKRTIPSTAVQLKVRMRALACLKPLRNMHAASAPPSPCGMDVRGHLVVQPPQISIIFLVRRLGLSCLAAYPACVAMRSVAVCTICTFCSRSMRAAASRRCHPQPRQPPAAFVVQC